MLSTARKRGSIPRQRAAEASDFLLFFDRESLLVVQAQFKIVVVLKCAITADDLVRLINLFVIKRRNTVVMKHRR